MRRSLTLALVLSLSLAALHAVAQEPHGIPAHKFERAPVIDGQIDDAEEWKHAPKVGGLLDPTTGSKAPEDGEFWLAYDEQYIYFAARLADSQPGSVRATEYRTNVSLSGDDSITLALDPEGNLRDFCVFEMNPRGATNLELPGGRAAKREWLGDFVAKGRITETGWEVEARIPWQVLPTAGSGKKDLRFFVERNHQRLNREYQFPRIDPGMIQNCCRWQGVEVPEQEKERTLKLLPYDYVGFAQGDDLIANNGLDLKTDLNSRMQLVGTINPDFRNVENQILSIDFSRFERLAGESRPFFQEGNQYLGSILYASQRIQNVDAGMNIYGKLNDKTTFGLLDTAYFKNQRENNLIGGFSHALDPDTYVGGAFTTTTRDEFDNDAFLLRFSKNIGPYGIFLRAAETHDSEEGIGNENLVNAWYSKNGFNWWGSYRNVSPDFRPRLGFTPERDYKGFNTGLDYGRPVATGIIQDYSIYTSMTDYQRYGGGSYRDFMNVGGFLGFRNGLGLSVDRSWSTFEGVKDQLWYVGVSKPRNDQRRSISLNYGWGELAGAQYKDIGASIAYMPTQKLQLSVSGQFVDHFSYDKQIILGASYDMGNDRSISCRAVQRGDDINAYFALRRSGNAGTEYFLIFGDPNANTFKNQFVLKMAYPMELSLGGKRKRVAAKPVESGPAAADSDTADSAAAPNTP